jgi:aspartokinase
MHVAHEYVDTIPVDVVGLPPMIVMKFGGTSVQDATAMDRALSIAETRLPRAPVGVA